MPRPGIFVTSEEMIEAYRSALNGAEHQIFFLTKLQQKTAAALSDREKTIAEQTETIAQRDARIAELEAELASLKDGAAAFLATSGELVEVVPADQPSAG